jgi:hypothetical protein
MQVLFLMWLALAGIMGFWGGLEIETAAPARTNDVEASEGPVSPPPKP